jgi:lantibiotic modifying enzyme
MTPAVAAQDAIEVAATIGFGIARRALWSGERCTWFDAVPTMPQQNPATSMMAGADLYGGTSGIGLFLAQAATRSGDALLRRTARAALRQAAARAGEYAQAAPHGFYGGAAGRAQPSCSPAAPSTTRRRSTPAAPFSSACRMKRRPPT